MAYLESVAGDFRSMSEALDSLIRQQQEQDEMRRISAGIRRYYDSMSEEERQENKAWGEFVAANYPKE